jgi:hypothetical protein
MFKHSKYILGNNSLVPSLLNVQKFNFARSLQRFIPIYPGDKVVVLPVWGISKLTPYAKRKVKTFHKEDAKVQYGTVMRMLRKKGQAIVSRVNEKPKYVSPSKFMAEYEFGNIAAIKRKTVNLPVAIDRVKLRDTSVKGSLKILDIRMGRNEAGERIRVRKDNGKEVTIPIRKRDMSYAKRTMGRKDGTKDTSPALRSVKTYNGENFAEIAKFFIKKIQTKENIESKLILRDL